jgi:tRNA A-37 threonylcarbamoyl transferase component Bud32
MNIHHFPEILQVLNKKLFLTHCGISLKEYEKTQNGINDTFFNSSGKLSDQAELQVECIISNLKKNKIKHWDLSNNNICIKDNLLYLIDFDQSSINNVVKPGSRGCRFLQSKCNGMNNYWDYAKQTIMNVLKMSLYTRPMSLSQNPSDFVSK